MGKVSVPVLWDIDSYLGGALMNIDVRSKYVATVSKPSAPYRPAFPTPPGFFIPTLQIEDPDFGVLYLNMTLQAYTDLLGIASQSPNVEKTYAVTIVGSPTSITDAQLYNATINQVLVGGIAVDIRTIGYTTDSITRTGTISGLSLSPSVVVQVLYHTN